MENSRTCDVCNVDVLRAFVQKLLKSKNHLENIRQNDIIIPEWLLKKEQTHIECQIK